MSFAIKLYLKNIIRLSPIYLRLRYIRLRENKKRLLIRTLMHAVKNVPYYKTNYGNIKGSNNFDISNFNYISKKTVSGSENYFLSKYICKNLVYKTSTGGTTGISVNLYFNFSSVIYKTFYTDIIFRNIASLNSLKIAVLRGNKPKKGIFDFNHNTLVLSSYDINFNNTKTYIALLKKYKINCIHAYPSSITILCKYIRELKNEIELPEIKGIITSSETITQQDKQLILNTFPNCKLIDIYGLNEQVAMAYSINQGYYTFIEEYSFVEFLDTNIITKDGALYEIVGTSYYNRAMPLIRYKTEDYVELDGKGNVLSIKGRTQDKIVNIDKEILPCIVLTRSETLKNVISFQYFQDKIGVLEFRVVPSANFGETDKRAIIYDIDKSFNKKVNVIVKLMNEIPRHKNGKQKRLIQQLDISSFI